MVRVLKLLLFPMVLLLAVQTPALAGSSTKPVKAHAVPRLRQVHHSHRIVQRFPWVSDRKWSKRGTVYAMGRRDMLADSLPYCTKIDGGVMQIALDGVHDDESYRVLLAPAAAHTRKAEGLLSPSAVPVGAWQPYDAIEIMLSHGRAQYTLPRFADYAKKYGDRAFAFQVMRIADPNPMQIW